MLPLLFLLQGLTAHAATLKASQTTICQGGSAVLTANAGAGVTGVTYTWSPNQSASATSGPQVVVAPLQTTTYTVTMTGSSIRLTTLSVTIVVNANCCQTSTVPHAQVVELDASYTANFAQPNYGYGDPFSYDFSTTPPTPRAPGTIFHVAGGTLTLSNNEFHLPVGGVLLMEPGADVVLDDARLYLGGATITAACDEMWGGLVHPTNGHGIYASPVGTLPPRLLHSQRGIELTRDPAAPASASYLFLEELQFLHNYRSLLLDYSGSAANANDFVRSCVFDSDPALMKQPYAPSGTDYWYTQTHVDVHGNASAFDFTNNSLAHAMVGITLTRGTPQLTVVDSHFANCYLAGIAGDGDASTGPGSGLTVYSSDFRFPTGSSLPATSQLTQTLASYGAALHDKETDGISTLFIPTTVTSTVFEQPDTSPYTTFRYRDFRPQQVGVASRALVEARGNTFRALGVGVAHTLVSGSSLVQGNLFTECEKGYDLLAPTAYTPVQPWGTSFANCNTFARGVSLAARSGVSYGIFNEDFNYVRLDDPLAPSANTTILKNLFDDAGTQAAGYYAPYNANANANIGAQLIYYTFKNYSSQIAPLVNAPQVNLTGLSASNAPNYTGQGIDCAPLGPNGLPRASADPAIPSSQIRLGRVLN
jgi:hypothetical protein